MSYYAPLVVKQQPPWRRGLSFSVVISLHLLALFIAFGWASQRPLPRVLEALTVRMVDAAPTPKVAPPKPLPPAPTPNPLPVMKPLPVLAAPAAAPAPGSFAVAPQAEARPAEAVPAPAVASAAVVAARFDADYLQNPKPVYPQQSRRMGEEGKVLLRVRVSSQGLPLAVEVKQSSGYARLDEAARVAVEKWRFVPARQGSEAVESWAVVPLRFSLDS